MENRSLATPDKTFKCLEDRLLTSLYQQEKPVPLESLAYPISITTNAALSIVHRIHRSHPHFLLINEQENGPMLISANNAQVNKVNRFLEKGGYTKINEAEFIRYYEKELKKEARIEKWQQFKTNLFGRKGVAATSFLIGTGILLNVFVKGKGKSNMTT